MMVSQLKKLLLGLLLLSIFLLGWYLCRIKKGQSMPEFIFPQPTGQYAVGTKLFELTDPTRNEQETGNPRELVAQVWYPSDEKPGATTASYAYEACEWYKSSFAQQGVKDVFDLVSQFDYGVVVDTNNKTVEKIVREIMVYLSKENRKCF